MRTALTVLLWLVTTVALAVAVPVVWAQETLIDVDGFAALAQSAAYDPELQDAMAAELTTQVSSAADVDERVVRPVASAYTASVWFPPQFAEVNRVAHQWFFTDAVRQSGDQWQVDLDPLLSGTSFQQALQEYDIQTPTNVTVPMTATGDLKPGELEPLARWGPWASIGAGAVAALAALLMLLSTRKRGKAVVALGVSALLAGGAGWAATEAIRPFIDDGLNNTAGDVRRVADAMVEHAGASLHHWLNITLVAGGVLVVLGLIAMALCGMRRKDSPPPGRPWQQY